MKKPKKVLSLFLALIMIISIIPVSSITASAEVSGHGYGLGDPYVEPDEYAYVYDDYGYNILDDGTIEIADYLGTDMNEHITIPQFIDGKKVTTIGRGAFCRSKVASVTIPDGVTLIGSYAFDACINLTSITIPDSVTKIGYGAFYYCRSISTITIPENVTLIDNRTFHHCYGLTKIIVDEDNQYYSSDEYGVLFNKDKTELIQYPIGNERTTYTVPNSVSSIYLCSFGKCAAIISVIIPNSVKSIGYEAFYDCTSLTNVTIGDSVTSIGRDTFYGCTGFTDVYYCGTEEQWNAITIDYDNDPLFNATKHFINEEHVCLFGDWETITEPTCMESGLKQRVCECGNAEKEELPSLGHDYSEWTVTKAPTYIHDGEETRVCSRCGKTESRPVDKLNHDGNEYYDAETDTTLICPEDAYDEDIELSVTEIYDGSSYQIISNEFGKIESKIFDISTTINGEKVQPNGKVLVRIPIPEGYNPDSIQIHYISSDGSRPQRMDSYVEDGYVYFETDHFSMYAIIDMSTQVGEFSIQKPSTTTIRHKDGIKLHANIEGTAPAGSYVEWTADNNKFKMEELNNGNSLKIVSDKNGTTTFTATLYSAEGEVLATDSIEMKSKAGFFDKIGSFFRGLFGTTKIYEN